MAEPAPVSRQSYCGYCGQPVLLTFVPDPARAALWTCPSIGCASQNIATGAARMISVAKHENKTA